MPGFRSTDRARAELKAFEAIIMTESGVFADMVSYAYVCMCVRRLCAVRAVCACSCARALAHLYMYMHVRISLTLALSHAQTISLSPDLASELE